MDKHTAVEIAGRNFFICEHDDVVDPVSGNALTGAWIWDCSFLLAEWLASPVWPPGCFQRKRVVELGAGTGLPGMVAAVLGAEAVVTDRPGLIPGLLKNVEGNGLSQLVRVQALEWGDHCSELSPPVDFILMSDVLYDVDAMPQLCDTLLELSDAGTQMLLAYELRLGTSECFEVMWERGLLFAKVGQEEIPAAWQHRDDVGIVRLRFHDSLLGSHTLFSQV